MPSHLCTFLDHVLLASLEFLLISSGMLPIEEHHQVVFDDFIGNIEACSFFKALDHIKYAQPFPVPILLYLLKLGHGAVIQSRRVGFYQIHHM